MGKFRGATWCGAPYCKNNSTTSKAENSGLSFFRFPKNETRAKEWVKACKREDLLDKPAIYLYKCVKLCSIHFESCMFETTHHSNSRRYLKQTAVPTIFHFPEFPDLIRFNKNPRSTKIFDQRQAISEKETISFRESLEGGYQLQTVDSEVDFQLPYPNEHTESEIILNKAPLETDFQLPLNFLQVNFETTEGATSTDFQLPVGISLDSFDIEMPSVEPIIVVHGGAGNYTYADIPVCLKGIRAAAIKGHQVLRAGGSILDATVAAVEVMEDDPQFNAGTLSLIVFAFLHLYFQLVTPL